MEVTNAVLIGVDFRRTVPCNQHLSVDVILIDKTNDFTQPAIYQLKKDSENIDFYTNKGLYNSNEESFMMIGVMATIQKKEKIIVLADGNTLSYNYLIIASQNEHQTSNSYKPCEFVAGLQALVDGLKFRQPVVNALQESSNLFSEKNENKLSHFCVFKAPTIPTKTIKTLLQKKSKLGESPSIEIITSKFRTYEVQL